MNMTYNLLCLSTFLLVVSSQECTQGFMDYELLSVKAAQIGNSTIDDTVSGIGNDEEDRRYVMPSLSFTCSGTITGLLLAVDIRIDYGRDEYPQIALYTEDGLIPRYTLVSGSNRSIILGPDDFSTSGLYNYTLSSPIQFTSGNIIGVYQPNTDDSVVRLQGQDYDDFNNYIFRLVPVNSDSRFRIDSFYGLFNSRLLVHPLLSTDGSTDCLSQVISLEDLRASARLVTTVDEPYAYTISTSTTLEDILFPDIKFTCDGFITHVIAGLEDNSGQTSNPPEITIWRSSNGGNTYTQSGPTIPLNYSDAVSDISTDYLRWYNLSVPVPVKEGDVLGIYQYTPTDENDTVIYYQYFSGPNNYDGLSGQSTGFNFYPLVSVVVDAVTQTSQSSMAALNSISSATTVSTTTTSTSTSYDILNSNTMSSNVAIGTLQSTNSLGSNINGSKSSTTTGSIFTTPSNSMPSNDDQLQFTDPVIIVPTTVVAIIICCSLCLTISVIGTVYYCKKKTSTHRTNKLTNEAEVPVEDNTEYLVVYDYISNSEMPNNEPIEGQEITDSCEWIEAYELIDSSQNTSVEPGTDYVDREIQMDINDCYGQRQNIYIEGRKL